ncbi:hypothetical protein, conserved in T. vivax [Trypanosoma vivax Y486]|uniref:Uncharacterized protein n=1 Tax=Trypanosoma vivax (strain Y486) TaxID=1055687 RepID=F9WV17_TRYVY|nr:hypothetical protein, conserved in T. vivax [Trypanosoma vivax Y486]|eukprot:CCD21418.1 hypothetical protein, conserved in T. vivax [Trypanosoma vivax Y486]
MATEKADRIDEFVRMLANYKAADGNGYCLGDGSATVVGTNNANPDDTGTGIGTGSGGKAARLKGCSSTSTTAMDYAKGKWKSDGHATALAEALAAFDSHWTQGSGKGVSAGSGGAACPLAKAATSNAAGYTADKVTFAGMFTAKTSTGLALLFKGSKATGLADVQALITKLTQLTTLADTELQQRKFLCVPSTDTTKHTTNTTALAKAAAAIYDELQAREAAHNARKNTPKAQGKGKGTGRTTRNSIAIVHGKKSRGRKQPGAHRDEGKANSGRGAPQRRHECSTCLARLARSVLSSSNGNAHIAHSGHKKQRTRGTKM